MLAISSPGAGISQPDISRILRGNVNGYSESRLIVILAALGNNVSIVVEPTKSHGHVCERCAGEMATLIAGCFPDQQVIGLALEMQAQPVATGLRRDERRHVERVGLAPRNTLGESNAESACVGVLQRSSGESGAATTAELNVRGSTDDRVAAGPCVERPAQRKNTSPAHAQAGRQYPGSCGVGVEPEALTSMRP